MSAAAIRAALRNPQRVLSGPQRAPGAPITPSAKLFNHQPRPTRHKGCYECANHLPRQIRDGVVIHIVGTETRDCEDEG